MERFGLSAKVTAKEGQRDALVEHLLEASRLLTPLPGCELYVINIAPSEPDTVLVYEAWRSEAEHDASLQLDSIRALIARAGPLIASFESIRLTPKGGKGLT